MITLTPVAIIQPKPGIGDVIWHLPFIRAVAAVSPGGAVTFITQPSTHAKELLQAESCVARTIYYEAGGSELRRGLNLLRLITLLRGERYEKLWIFDRTLRPAFAALVAGIPHRIGLGLGPQRLFITNPGISQDHYHDLPMEWISALMASMNVPCPTTEPHLQLPKERIAAIHGRYGACPRPWVVVALGASHPDKDWPTEYWLEFLTKLRLRMKGSLFLIGGPSQLRRAAELTERVDGVEAVNACGLDIVDASALLHESDLFIGPDSGPMNIAVAVGIPAFGLFGATPILAYSKFIHPILPDDGRGPAPGGMGWISPGKVIEQIESYLLSSPTR